MSGGHGVKPHYRSVVGRLERPRRPRELPCHCWVEEAPELPGRRAGLLLAWVPKRDGGWLGRVAVGAKGAEGDMVMVLLVDAKHLTAG